MCLKYSYCVYNCWIVLIMELFTLDLLSVNNNFSKVCRVQNRRCDFYSYRLGYIIFWFTITLITWIYFYDPYNNVLLSAALLTMIVLEVGLGSSSNPIVICIRLCFHILPPYTLTLSIRTLFELVSKRSTCLSVHPVVRDVSKVSIDLTIWTK